MRTRAGVVGVAGLAVFAAASGPALATPTPTTQTATTQGAAQPGDANVASNAAAPKAASWVADVAVLSGRVLPLRVADARVGTAKPAEGWAAPLTVNGQSIHPALATAATPKSTAAALDYTDQTGSITITGGYARATTDPGNVTAATGVASGTGNSFALASKMLSWDQQKELTDEVAALNDAVFDPLNARLQALAPVLAIAGLTVPQFTKMSALAVINVGGMDGAASTASAATGPGMSSARSSVSLGAVQMLDGFVSVDGLHGNATSEDVDGATNRTATVDLGHVSIAGVDVTVDDSGVHALGNPILVRTTVQPALDLLLSTLAAGGVTLRFDDSAAHGDLREATGLQLSVASPQGGLTVSVGHVEAAAPAPAPPPAQPPGSTPRAHMPKPVTATPVAVAPQAPTATTAGAGAVTPVAAGAPPAGVTATTATRHGVPAWLGATLPAAVARALGIVFVLLLLGGLGATAIPVVVMRVRRQRPRRIVPTVIGR